MRRTLLLIILAVYLPAHPAPAQQKFLMGYSSFSSNQIPLWVAKDEGLFKRYGTDPDLILIEGGTRGGQALISGDVPVMGMSGQPVISARARGADLVMIAGVVNKMNYVLVGAPARQETRGPQRQTDRRGAGRHGVLSCGLARTETLGTRSPAGIGLRYCSWAIRERGSPRSNPVAATRSSSIPVSDRR